MPLDRSTMIQMMANANAMNPPCMSLSTLRLSSKMWVTYKLMASACIRETLEIVTQTITTSIMMKKMKTTKMTRG